MKKLMLILCLFAAQLLSAQGGAEPWVESQLSEVVWKKVYKGVLADFHPITIALSSDHDQIAGYIMHDGDQHQHRLQGDWNKNSRFMLQERDANDRLTGYLSGTITDDQLLMEWMSADQSRMFEVRAFPQALILIKTFKPVAEWIEVASSPSISISVQKMDFGIVSGIANRNGHYSRFEGYCLDGSCSIWNTVIQNPAGAPIRVQMRQKDAATYKALLDGTEYTGVITSSSPIHIRKFDNSIGFLDFVFPGLNSVAFETWVKNWIDPQWTEAIDYLKKAEHQHTVGRLVHRSSGWIEIFDDGPSFTSGMITYILPGTTKRAPFVWLKREETILSMSELLNLPDDVQKASQQALKKMSADADDAYQAWLQKVGYTFILPTSRGLLATTEFNMIYGDDIVLLPAASGKEMIKRKYWKYFGW